LHRFARRLPGSRRGRCWHRLVRTVCRESDRGWVVAAPEPWWCPGHQSRGPSGLAPRVTGHAPSVSRRQPRRVLCAGGVSLRPAALATGVVPGTETDSNCASRGWDRHGGAHLRANLAQTAHHAACPRDRDRARPRVLVDGDAAVVVLAGWWCPAA